VGMIVGFGKRVVLVSSVDVARSLSRRACVCLMYYTGCLSIWVVGVRFGFDILCE
jgi:hypothetical protein